MYYTQTVIEDILAQKYEASEMYSFLKIFTLLTKSFIYNHQYKAFDICNVHHFSFRPHHPPLPDPAKQTHQ